MNRNRMDSTLVISQIWDDRRVTLSHDSIADSVSAEIVDLAEKVKTRTGVTHQNSPKLMVDRCNTQLAAETSWYVYRLVQGWAARVISNAMRARHKCIYLTHCPFFFSLQIILLHMNCITVSYLNKKIQFVRCNKIILSHIYLHTFTYS